MQPVYQQAVPQQVGTTSAQNYVIQAAPIEALTNASFNLNVKAFVPKGKIVKTIEEFPELGGSAAEKPKTKGSVQPNKEKKAEENEDPTKGKFSDFFVINPVEPNYPANP